MLYPLGLQERIKPSRFYDAPSMVVVLVPLQCLIQAFEDVGPEASGWAEIPYILRDMC